ncbi:MAG: 30S ribosomal protein S7 [Candidatus Micrarchaeales archaeon]|nr:30S ribosomal protein S7 [Candidatus Micrarchaeales archaeon]
MAEEIAQVEEKKEPAVQQPVPAAEAQPTEAKKPRKRAPKAAPPSGESIVIGPKAEILLFNKYSYDVEILDPSLRNYVNLRPMVYPESFRRTSGKRFSKANINIVERLANDMMRGGTGGKISGKTVRTKGRLQGKKITVMLVIEGAFGMVAKQTGKNPLQVFINALENAAPIEDTTRVRYGGIISNVSVDISASRRLDVAIRNLSMAAIVGSFNNKRDITSTLASEIILAAKNDINSYAIKRKNEIERMARSAK